jgi:hypothetical protein
MPSRGKEGYHQNAKISAAFQDINEQAKIKLTLLVGLLPRPNLLAGLPSGIL